MKYARDFPAPTPEEKVTDEQVDAAMDALDEDAEKSTVDFYEKFKLWRSKVATGLEESKKTTKELVATMWEAYEPDREQDRINFLINQAVFSGGLCIPLIMAHRFVAKNLYGSPKANKLAEKYVQAGVGSNPQMKEFCSAVGSGDYRSYRRNDEPIWKPEHLTDTVPPEEKKWPRDWLVTCMGNCGGAANLFARQADNMETLYKKVKWALHYGAIGIWNVFHTHVKPAVTEIYTKLMEDEQDRQAPVVKPQQPDFE